MLRIPQLFAISETALRGFLNRVNDPVAGGTQPLGSVVPGGGVVNSQNLKAGQLGFEVELDTPTALSLSDTTVGTLFAGIYQYVQVALGGAAPVRGAAAFVATPLAGGNYTVTADAATAANLQFPVGVFINPITLGNFGWIQVGGLASLQFVTAITNELSGKLVKIVNQAGLGFGQQIDADVLTITVAAQMIGVAAELPVDNTITRVWLSHAVRLL